MMRIAAKLVSMLMTEDHKQHWFEVCKDLLEKANNGTHYLRKS